MASDNKTTTEDADMAECDGEKVVTMMDVLQEQEDFEEDANAVLGASDDKECTYSKGYIKRQAIYACMTCCPEAKLDPTKRAGVCLACSLMCHENHELVELYTKRNFRCDCGNPKFNSHPCTFTPDKTDLNEENYYNQNFSGLYCTCQRPYPDPESTVEDEMIQCIICEDWLHATHLESTVPANEQYSEMICKICMEKNEFLHDYSELAVNIESVIVDVVSINGSDAHNPTSCNGDTKTEASDSTLSENVTKPDIEMSEEKVDENVPVTETLAQESKEGNENETASKDESDTSDKKEDESMETNQSKQIQPTDTTTEETSAPINQEPTTDKIEEGENTEIETKTDTISEVDNSSKDISDEPSATVGSTADKPESSEEVTPVPEQSDVKEQQSTDETSKKTDEDDPIADAEKPKIETEEEMKENEQNAEKMEEDRLLADPEDTPKTETIDHDKNSIDNNVTINDAATHEKEETKLEIESNSDIREKSNTSDEKLDLDEASRNTEQNKNESNTDKCSENDPSTNNESESKVQPESIIEKEKTTVESTIQNESTTDESSSTEKVSEKRKIEEESSENKEAKKPKLDDKVCVRPKAVKKVYKGATFWPSNFRQKLCTCQECISMYNDLSVLFLTDPEDTVSAYENLGKEKINGKPTTQYEKGLQALSSLDRIQQINALTEYNRMRDKLLDFLKSFKDRKEIVKEEDIKAFFAGMKPKREQDGVYFCR